MLNHATADLTLPSVSGKAASAIEDEALVLTIVFHPDTKRIGETAYLGCCSGPCTWELGRHQPVFSRYQTDGPALGIDDSYVSRAALQLRIGKGDGELSLQRTETSSRCSIAGIDMGREAQVTSSHLSRGVPILLAGRVVLLLRKGTNLEPDPGPPCGHGMVGGSAYMRRLRKMISKLAATELDVLIHGETGTGKELVAAALHGASSRSSKSLVAVNMAAVPDALAPAALFGTVKGAYTGADKSTPGYFQQADGSTLFLDEVGDTSMEVQPLLLRALQQREIQRVGGTIQAVDTRVISATDVALNDASCNFKAALRYRLSECEIELAPLRDHLEDIGELLWTFISHELVSMGRAHVLPARCDSPESIALWAELFHAFVCYRWPGNIRQLSNYARQVAVVSDINVCIPMGVRKSLSTTGKSTVEHARTPVQSIKSYTDDEFLASYASARYEVTRVAKQLGLSRQAVYRRISLMPGLCLASELSSAQIRSALSDACGDHALAAMQLKVSLAGLRERIRNSPNAISS